MSIASADRAPAQRRWIWAALVILSFAVRLTWWQAGVRVIENEGTNYARLGENIAAGRGYLGLDELGSQLIYPPLYPGLIAVGVRLGLSAEDTGRGISLIFGSFAPLLFGLIAARLYGRSAGWMAALLAALHPLLIVASTAVLSEATYLSLLLLGLYAAIGMLTAPRRIVAVGAGAALGLAYLCRPEALFVAVALAAIIVFASAAPRRLTTRCCAWMFAAFAVFAIPYVLFLHRETGQWRFEAKTGQGKIWQVGAASGRGPGELYWGIDGDLTERGISNTSDFAQLHHVADPAAPRARIAARQIVANLPKLFAGLGHLQFGMPFLAMLIAAGLFAEPWDLTRGRRELPFLALIVLTIGPFLLWPFTLDRSLFMLLAAFIPWAGRGLALLGGWTLATAHAMRAGARTRIIVRGAVIAIAVTAVSLAALLGVRNSDEMSQSWSTLAAYAPIGRWVGAQAPHARIMDVGPTVAYYAGAVLVRFPWTDSPTALRYLASRRIDFVVLREQSLGARPYLRSWYDQVPDPRLELLRTFSDESGTTRVYRWNRDVNVAVTSEPVPRVSLDIAGSGTAGTTLTLRWSAENVSDCAAAGGWSGRRAPSGMETVTAVATASTFALTCTGAHGTVHARAAAIPPPVFPLRTAAGTHHLLDARGRPFLMHGDSPWSLMTQLTRPEVDRYLADRAAKGFNTILVELIENHFSRDPPNNAYGAPPFLTAGDFSTPNEAYFAHAEYVIRRAGEHGMVVLLAPAYMGYDGGDEGWYRTLVANGAPRLRAYGQYLARRFRAYDNIIWVHGGDYNPPDRALLRAVPAGILDVEPKWLHTFHGVRRTSAREFLGDSESWLTLNTIYTGSAVLESAYEERSRSRMPFFLIEAVYEDASSDEVVRRQAYHAILGGATGQLMGINPVWSFATGWQRALDSPGAVTLRHLRDLFAARPWWTLEPDSNGTLLTGGRGFGSEDAAAAAVSTDGSFAIAYLPGVRDVTLDLRRLAGPRVTAWWYDPTSGAYATVAGAPFSRSAAISFRPATLNSLGRGDWVLLLESSR